MGPSIFLGRVATVAQTLFYANADTRTPYISDIIFTVSHTALAFLLVGFRGVLGLPIAVSLASLLTTMYMLVKLQARFGPIGWGELGGFAWRLSATCAMAGVGFALGARVATLTTVPYSAAKLIDFALPTAFSACLFITGAFLFRLLDGYSGGSRLLRS
jgi:peptidoglycan biosynthesis protein MviN/MurJ (putative lipid II flippase)